MEGHGRSNGSKYDCLLFDMDDTLYPMSSGINYACAKNIQEYMLKHLKIEASEVPRMCFELYKEYGTTMAGLKALGYEFDNDEFHEYVHGRLPYDGLKPDLVLRNLLLSMTQRKIIFTNADSAHVAQVLNRLGLEDCFEGIICFETLNPLLEVNMYDVEKDESMSSTDNYLNEAVESEAKLVDHIDSNNLAPQRRVLCKPSVEAIEAAIQVAHIDPKRTIFFDDSARNIESGKVAGLHTVIVGRSVLVPGADVALENIHNIREALPEIWVGEEEALQVEHLLHPTTVETVVLA